MHFKPSNQLANVPWGSTQTTLGVATASVGSACTVGLMFLVWPGVTPTWAILLGTLILEVVLFASAFTLGPGRRSSLTLLYGSTRLGSRQLFAWGTLALLASLFLTTVYTIIATAIAPSLVPSPLPSDLDLSELRWLAFAIIVVVGPVAEETFFRGFLFAGLVRRLGTASSIAISSVLFAVAHVDPALFGPALLSGSVFALVYWRTGSVWPAILAHTAQNAVAFGLTG